jgi:hypothetical protein
MVASGNEADPPGNGSLAFAHGSVGGSIPSATVMEIPGSARSIVSSCRSTTTGGTALADSRSTVLSSLLTLVLVGLVASGCGGSTDPGGGGTGNRPASLQIVSGDVQVSAVGTELPAALVVKVLDAAGAPVAGQAINFRVVAGGGTTFAGVGTTNANGMAQERWTVGTTAGPQRLEARAVDSATGVAIVYGTFTATAVAGPPVGVTVISGDGQSGPPSTALASPIVVRLADSYGNPVLSAAVIFAVTSGGGVASPATASTDSTGTASTTWTLGVQNGAQTLEAQVTGVPAAVVHATASSNAYLRVANLSPDLGPLDFCVRTTGATTWGDPVMAAAGATSGLVYDGGTGIDGMAQVSRYFDFASGTYDVAVYQKALLGASCAAPTATKTGVSLDNGVYKLVAAVGYTGSTTAPHALASFTDERTVTTGNMAIRFANVGILPGATFGPLPPIDVGITTASAPYAAILKNVTYPGVAPASTSAPVIDANGYAVLPATSFAGAVQLTVCPAGLTPTTAPAGYCQSTNLAAGLITPGTVASAYVIGVAGTPPNLLLCGDNTGPPSVGYNYSLCLTKLP